MTDKDIYAADELNAPEWLNSEFLTEVLRKHIKLPDLKVLELKFSPATVVGDHYASIMFRAAVEYTAEGATNSKSLIIKTMPEQEGHKKDMVGESYLFETEIGMYTKVLPKFESILKSIGDDTVLCAKCLYHSLTPRKVMIFEDLVQQGYSVLRDRAINLTELRAALSKLAKIHAVSFKLLKEQPEYFKEFKYDVTTLPNILDEYFVTSGLPNFITMLEQVPSLTKYKKYFEQMKDKLLPRWQAILREYREDRKTTDYYVLCHGDLHLRNMMFKNNKATGALEDCMLLDYQISNVGSITNDLSYGLYMLFNAEQRKDHRDELLYYYFNTFKETLQKIGYKQELPSLVELRKQIFDRRHSEFLLLTSFLPIMLALSKEPVDFGCLIQSPERLRKLFFDADFISEMEYLLPHMLHLGYFEQI